MLVAKATVYTVVVLLYLPKVVVVCSVFLTTIRLVAACQGDAAAVPRAQMW
jgi:hypothetical protein